ncbi:MAG: HAD family hydrolase [Ancrocorticia sp.]|uniref:HAD family hydrolase n=1 Tax=Ancrocorticia sp. TaxID=2593684 RepID=UPI003F8DD8BC
MKRLVFLDVDGTLINGNQEIPGSARAAIREALAAGHTLIICTGRAKPEIYPFLWDLGFQGFIGCNGAYGDLGGERIFADLMPASDVSEICSWLEENGAAWLWQGTDTLYPHGFFLDVFKQDESEGGVSGDWSGFLRQIEPALDWSVPERALKVTFVFPKDSPVGMAEAVERFGDRFCILPGSLVPGGFHDMSELTAKGMSKAVGVKAFAKHLGVDLSDVIAFGDSANDREMLEAVGHGIAMGNHRDGIEEVAAWTTRSVDDDGLAFGFRELGLIK